MAVRCGLAVTASRAGVSAGTAIPDPAAAMPPKRNDLRAGDATLAAYRGRR